MTDTSTAKLIGTALIVSEDAVATRQLAEAMQELALSVEVCIKVSDVLDRVNRSKLEVAVDLTGQICTRWNERESTWRKHGSCPSRGTNQSKS
jgi:hypothetical protein